MRALPSGVPLPEFAPESDGEVALDWVRSRHSIFSVSVGASGRLAYAWIDGTDRGHEVIGFDGTSVPGRLLSEIRGTMRDEDAPLRVA